MSISTRLKCFAAALGQNLRLLPALARRRPFPRDRIDGGPAQILASFALVFAAGLGLSAWYAWPIGEIEPYGIAPFFGSATVTLGCVTLGALLTGAGTLVGPALVMVNLASVVVYAVAFVVYALLPPGIAAYIVAAAILLILPGVALLRVLARPGRAGAVAGLPAFGLLLAAGLAWQVFIPQVDLFYSAEVAAVDEAANDWPEIATEDLYHAQPPLMQAALGRLAPGTPDRPELFAILGGGVAYESVFLSEVERVGTLIAERYGADHVLALANSAAAPTRLPMLSHHNLAAALDAVAERMGPEDAALLFLTSHGSADSVSLGFWAAGLEDLSASQLAAALDAAGLRNLVVVVSACHSGSFVDDLAAPDRLIVTASAADRTSFGCADGRDWTDFGRAYFDIAFRETQDFRSAFTRAQALVETWEAEQGRRPSLPQIAEGAAIGPVLDRLVATELAQRD